MPGATDAAASTTGQDRTPEVVQRGQPVVDHARDPPPPCDDPLVLLTFTDGASVELRPTRYEHPVAPLAPPEADEWDANWLQIAGAVCTASGQGWEFDDPCLTTWEARELGRWLRAAAHGEAAVSESPEREPVGVLEFTEPNLAFNIAARGGEDLVVRVRLSHESTPGWPWPDAWDEDGASWGSRALDVALSISRQNLLHAAHTWENDLAPFPHRPANHHH